MADLSDKDLEKKIKENALTSGEYAIAYAILQLAANAKGVAKALETIGGAASSLEKVARRVAERG